MDGIKQKMNDLRTRAEKLSEENDDLKKKVKDLEQENLAKDHEIASLTHRHGALESDNERLNTDLKTHKELAGDSAKFGTENENLQRKLAVLEEEAETADKNLRETNEKLRLVDVKAEHFERKVTSLEAARDQWEQKYEEMTEKYNKVQRELEEFRRDIEGL